MKTIINKAVLLIIALICFLGVVLYGSVSPIYASAVPDLKYDKTNVLDDLKADSDFKLSDYPVNKISGTLQVIKLVEYCYSYSANLQDNYSLYVYVYNPAQINLSTLTNLNKIQIASGYDSDGKPNNYDKYKLKLCSLSTDTENYKLFYKFKVDWTSEERTNVLNRLSSDKRRYDVSGIELVTNGDINAVDYTVGTTYFFTGYVKGYGKVGQTESTLECSFDKLLTIPLEVKHTFFRTASAQMGADHQNQLDSVYFSVDNSLLKEFGRLQKIKAEWYEYKTNDIVVTSNNDFYNRAKNYMGYTFGADEYNTDLKYSLSSEFLSWGPIGVIETIASWRWNYPSVIAIDPISRLDYLFSTGGRSINVYDPYGANNSGSILGNDLYNYILNYDKSASSGYLPIKDGRTINADLFQDTVDNNRLRGKNVHEFDADIDLFDMLSYEDGNPSFWDKLIDFGFWQLISGNLTLDDGYYDIPPIYAVKDTDLQLSDYDIVKKLLIRTEDIGSFKSYFNTAKQNDKTTFLFRFANTDYYSQWLDIYDEPNFIGYRAKTSGEAYRAIETCFFDFDIIHLGFQKDGILTIIPVVSNPIDIVDDITAPTTQPNSKYDWLKWLLGLILVVLLLLFLMPVIPHIISAIVWLIKGIVKIITFPFKLVAEVVKPDKPGSSSGATSAKVKPPKGKYNGKK